MKEFRTEMLRWAPMACWFNATMLRRSLISACLVSFASLYLLSCVATRSQRSPGNLLGSRRSCDVKLEDVSRFGRSQDKEDEFLVQHFFEKICGGTYVELGALDGVKYSNSHLFHYGLDWRGCSLSLIRRISGASGIIDPRTTRSTARCAPARPKCDS